MYSIFFQHYFFSYNYCNLSFFYNYFVLYENFKLKVDVLSFFFLDMYIESYRFCAYYQYIFSHPLFLKRLIRRFYLPFILIILTIGLSYCFILQYFRSMFIERVYIFYIISDQVVPFFLNTHFILYAYLYFSEIGSSFGYLGSSALYKRFFHFLHSETIQSYVFYFVYNYFMSHARLYYMER